MLLEDAVVDGVGARVDEHLVVAVEREDVELALPVVPAVVRAGVAVVGVVEDEAVGDVGGLDDGGGDAGEAAGQVGLRAVPGEVGVCDVAQVPVEAGELHGGRGALDEEVSGGAGDPVGVLGGAARVAGTAGAVGVVSAVGLGGPGADRTEGHLPVMVRKQPLQGSRRRAARDRGVRCGRVRGGARVRVRRVRVGCGRMCGGDSEGGGPGESAEQRTSGDVHE